MSSIHLALLADHPELARVIGKWHWDEWGDEEPLGSEAEWTHRLAEAAGRGEVPTVWVAFVDAEPAGSVVLVDHDMDIHRDCTPWLGGLYVKQEFRGLGIAQQLVRTCEAAAAALGYPALYLQTEIPGFYAQLGWREYAREHYLGDDVVVMVSEVG